MSGRPNRPNNKKLTLQLKQNAFLSKVLNDRMKKKVEKERETKL
jgi:hypothetical protein